MANIILLANDDISFNAIQQKFKEIGTFPAKARAKIQLK